MTDRDGRDIACTAEQKGGVLTVTVDEDLAILTGRLSGLRTLRARGVEKIVFVTKGATSAFLLSDLTEKGESSEAYRLTHDTKAVTFTLGDKMTDVMNAAKVGRTDAAVLAAANIADELFKEREASEALRRQLKQYIDDAAQAKNEVSELKRELFKLQNRK